MWGRIFTWEVKAFCLDSFNLIGFFFYAVCGLPHYKKLMCGINVLKQWNSIDQVIFKLRNKPHRLLAPVTDAASCSLQGSHFYSGFRREKLFSTGNFVFLTGLKKEEYIQVLGVRGCPLDATPPPPTTVFTRQRLLFRFLCT